MTTQEILTKAVAARRALAVLRSEDKNTALLKMAERLEEATSAILAANAADLEQYGHTMTVVMQDRLRLTAERIADMAKGIREVVELPDPVGAVLERVERPNGMVIEKTAVPMGVVAIIYESRPNVTSDAAALAFKSGNVCILRSGKEAWHSAKAITDALRKGLADAGLPEDSVQLIEDTTRQSARELMEAVGYVDLLIPRGGPGLINACLEGAKVPVIQTGTGICHIYVDETADFEKALNIIENAKTSRPSVCNAAEVCLVHEKIADAFLPRLKAKLEQVEFRCDPKAQEIMQATAAGERDFDTEFLDYIMAVKVVEDVSEAIAHIAAHSTGHSEAIVTETAENADLFTAMVDSAAVYVNVSTRFTDGGQFGLGCEMGISTQKLHARGPMGLRELTTYKYIVRGDGQIRG
ncbi:MAG: glutamate-5-semialdehyde dehydrogenase [Clostridia bacterium]|nr:glutamate-5-semialdehyde dehydrogenase [Clostridia bacterium]